MDVIGVLFYIIVEVKVFVFGLFFIIELVKLFVKNSIVVKKFNNFYVIDSEMEIEF